MTDTNPRLYRRNLVPDGAVGTPGPVLEADAKLRSSALAADQATADRIAADKADRAAAQHDSRAAVAAVEAGEPTPQPTATDKKAAYERAVEHEAAAKLLARRAMLALGRTVVEHREGWREAQRQHVFAQAEAALALIDDVERELGLLGQGLGVLASLARDEIDIDHGLGFKSPIVGSAQRQPVDKILDELRAVIRKAMPAQPPTEEEQRRQHDLQERNRQWRQMAAGGLHVPGGAG